MMIFYLQMDVGNNVTSFCRNILSVDVKKVGNSGCVKRQVMYIKNKFV